MLRHHPSLLKPSSDSGPSNPSRPSVTASVSVFLETQRASRSCLRRSRAIRTAVESLEVEVKEARSSATLVTGEAGGEED